MKKNVLYLLLSLFIIPLPYSFAQDLYVGTYNIRYENGSDNKEGNGWSRRCRVICDQINFEHPDILGCQEVLSNQLEDMLLYLDNYSYIGRGRDDGASSGEHSAIFYDNNKLTLLENGDFWLSETPEQPSLGWDAACKRICTWGLFEINHSDFRFYFFNLHMDHIGVIARRESTKLVLSRIAPYLSEDIPIILTGDFNVDQRDEIYHLITDSGMLNDSYEVARLRFAENGTFTDYNQTLLTPSRIDHVFISSHFLADRYGILTNTYWNTRGRTNKYGEYPNSDRRLPSDHYPVLVHLKYH